MTCYSKIEETLVTSWLYDRGLGAEGTKSLIATPHKIKIKLQTGKFSFNLTISFRSHVSDFVKTSKLLWFHALDNVHAITHATEKVDSSNQFPSLFLWKNNNIY